MYSGHVGLDFDLWDYGLQCVSSQQNENLVIEIMETQKIISDISEHIFTTAPSVHEGTWSTEGNPSPSSSSVINWTNQNKADNLKLLYE